MIIDATVLVAAAVDAGRDGTWAEGIIAEGDLVAPELAFIEATNILRGLEMARTLSPPQASAARQDLMRIEIRLFPFEPIAERVWALRRNVTSYDATYVAIAEALDLPLATLDRRLASATGPKCRFVLPPQ